MLLPDDKSQTLRNCFGMAAILSLLYLVAWVLVTADQLSTLTVSIACLVLFAVLVGVLSTWQRVALEGSNQFYAVYSKRAVLLSLLLATGLTIVLVTSPSDSALGSSDALSKPFTGADLSCQQGVSQGQWTLDTTCQENPTVISKASTPYQLNGWAICHLHTWAWDPSITQRCPLGYIPGSKARAVYKGKQVVFLGDSTIRNSYHQFVTMLDPTYKQTTNNPDLKHGDLTYTPPSSPALVNTSVSFIWAPFMTNLTAILGLRPVLTTADMVVMGAAAWDSLYYHDLPAYKTASSKLIDTLSGSKLKSGQVLVWVQPTTIVDDKLGTPEKRQYITETRIQTYREAITSNDAFIGYFNTHGTVLDTALVAASRPEDTMDGVHYTNEIYQLIIQMIANAYTMRNPNNYKKASKSPVNNTPQATGSMSFPIYGLYVLLLITTMLFTMDSWLGVGYISLLICGRKYDYDAAYLPLINKILGGTRNRSDAAPGNTSANTTGSSKSRHGDDSSSGAKGAGGGGGGKQQLEIDEEEEEKQGLIDKPHTIATNFESKP